MDPDINTKIINRVLFCTSPLQVVNARSAMDYLNSDNNCRDFVVIIHPLLLDSTKNLIKDLAKKMNYEEVFDLSDLVKIHTLSNLSFTKKIINFKGIVLNSINQYQLSHKKIYSALKNKIGNIDIVFCRMNYDYLDLLFINSQKNSYKIGIEDGIGDYVPKYWYLIRINLYEIKHKIKSIIRSYSFFFISIFFTRSLKASLLMFFKPKNKYKDSYTNIETKNSIYIGKQFKKNINLLLKQNHDKKIGIIIIGTLLDSRFKFNIAREVQLYNKLIKILSDKYEITPEEIWYKPHPRLLKKDWEFMQNKLNCSIYTFSQHTIAEVELLNKNLRAIYSVSSSTLLYAKKLFDIDSYLIDIRKEGCHPSSYKKAYYLAKKFDINIIKI